MPMDSTQLKSEILTALEACGFDITAAQNSGYVGIDCLIDAIATKVVEHIQANAVTAPAGDPSHTHSIT